MSRKADVVMAVRGGLLTMEAACWRYSLTHAEFLAWQEAFERFGIAGLSAKGLREVREMQKMRNVEQSRLLKK